MTGNPLKRPLPKELLTEASLERFAREIHEHFDFNNQEYLYTYVGNKRAIGDIFINSGTLQSNDASYLVLSSGTGELELGCLKAFNPAHHGSLSFVIKMKNNQDDATSLLIGFCDPGQTLSDCAVIMEASGGAGKIAFYSDVASGGGETTDDIVCDMSEEHEYRIDITPTSAKLYVDGVLKATHTSKVPYDVSGGLTIFVHEEKDALNNPTIGYFDLINILLGRL